LHLILIIYILLDGLQEKRGFCEWNDEAVTRALWRTRFGRGFGPAVRRTTEWKN